MNNTPTEQNNYNTTAKKRVLSGIRATGRLHLGNYLGAVEGMLELQKDQNIETLYMVADIHTITTPYRVAELRDNRRQVILDYLAAGLDPEKSIIFLQSMVPQHTELSFYFSSLMSIARMQHLPTFKDKVKQYPDHATMALLNYPILMSADILVYKAGLVPVGIDQEPHLEVAREVARKMNEAYGLDFPEPQRFATQGEYVPSLRGEGKMSKSVEGSFINLTDDLSTITKRLSSAPTDSGTGSISRHANEKGKVTVEYHDQLGSESPGVKSLLEFVELFQGSAKRAEYETLYESTGLRYGDLKKELAAAIFAELQPMQEKRAQLEADPAYVTEVIESGAARARAIAQETVQKVREAMGLG
jgi:tryptophanyl-tRNA synthetase